MIGLDTNVLLRYFVTDDEAQAASIQHFMRRLSEDAPAFVNRIVLCELVWTLRSSYKLRRVEIAAILEQLLETESLVIEEALMVKEALYLYRTHDLDFADALIATMNHHAGVAHTVTFDKKAAALKQFRLLK